MLLHHETYRLLVQERMNQYLREAAMDRRTNIAGVGGEWVEPGSGRTAARLLRALVRMLMPHMRERGAACGETGRGAR